MKLLQQMKGHNGIFPDADCEDVEVNCSGIAFFGLNVTGDNRAI